MYKMIVGNWKMNGTSADLEEFFDFANDWLNPMFDLMICPPATLIGRMTGTSVMIGAQDCHADVKGAHTGDISAEMLADAGATHVIVGHSERRTDHAETNAMVAAKTNAAWNAEMKVILCIGETEAQYRAGETLDVLRTQMAESIPDGAMKTNITIAYEPVWAIGTGLTPTLQEIADVHAFIRETLVARFGDAGAAMPLLYGGSVKASNARDIFVLPNVNGGLVGGASLRKADFTPICSALEQA
ncbi:triose-phosphate isomerase [Octadecabacter sp. G9-8]|uniref:Triosephosphate isomerase n=1 Tax=Octadecabacter dasysiphoniae TaxID=2909341 RepID=A0ABS9CZU0_9RHOB|nr:triose-phosphate isomerase [Octadecabacter dasysiphoniae]MCF2872719.1 triose-phosphate isomerase [Octadecabacter dasysiphoniae]